MNITEKSIKDNIKRLENILENTYKLINKNKKLLMKVCNHEWGDIRYWHAPNGNDYETTICNKCGEKKE